MSVDSGGCVEVYTLEGHWSRRVKSKADSDLSMFFVARTIAQRFPL